MEENKKKEKPDYQEYLDKGIDIERRWIDIREEIDEDWVGLWIRSI